MLKVRPSGGECLDQVRAHSSFRCPQVSLRSTTKGEGRNTRMHARDIFSPYRAFLTLIRYTWVDVEWRCTKVSPGGTYRLGQHLEIIP
jgi:hypothetical protein